MRAFNQMSMAEEDIPKTAVITAFGLFEFIYMGFGLRNAAQTFQGFIDKVLQGLDFCYAYSDDILVASTNEEEHLQHLKQLFDRLKQYNVVINPQKCTFATNEIKFFGYILTKKEHDHFQRRRRPYSILDNCPQSKVDASF